MGQDECHGNTGSDAPTADRVGARCGISLQPARSSKSNRTLRIGLESNDHCSDTHSTPQLQTGLHDGPCRCQSSIREELKDIQVMMSQYARELVRSSCRHDPNIVKVALFRREGITA